MAKVCSPLYCCFPPQPTICAICDGLDDSNCPLKPVVNPSQSPQERSSGHRSHDEPLDTKG